MNDINCPYCNAEQDINHDDGYGYEEGELHNQQCSECEKEFAYTTAILYHYEALKADCLNDGKHIYKPTTTYPVFFTEMECVTCGERHNPTDAERREHDIPLTYNP